MARTSRIIAAAIMTAVTLAFGAHRACAQQTLSVEDLIGKLQNRAPGVDDGGSRGLTVEELEQRQRNRVHVVPSPAGGRDLTVEERRDVAVEAKRSALPTADLEVYFDYDSAVISPAATPILITLGQALSDGRLKGGTFIVAGHTDAKGTADYNQQLSQRRAKAVREFLVSNFAIEPGKLVAVGYGKEQLKSTADPFAAINRRVQVINWTGVAVR